MKQPPFLSIYKRFLCLLLPVTCIVNAQKLTYSPVVNKVYGVQYVVGKQDDNIIVWLYNATENNLQLDVFDNDMRLKKKALLNMSKLGTAANIRLLQKHNCYNILVQSSSGSDIKNQVYSYSDTDNAILPAKVLENTSLNAELTIKSSNDDNLIGFIQGLKTTGDSAIIQYSVYNKQYELVKSIGFSLPQKHDVTNLNASLIDNAGNLIFNATRNIENDIPSQDITVYEVNLSKNTLRTYDIVKNGQFENIVIQQDNNHGGLNISGIWKNNNLQNGYSDKVYFFMITLNENLSKDAAMTLFSATRMLDSIYSGNALLNEANFILNKDKGYTLYLTGITNYSGRPLYNYNTFGYSASAGKPNLPEIHSFYEGRATTSDLVNPVAPNISNIYAPYGNNPNSTSNPLIPKTNDYTPPPLPSNSGSVAAGNNFFLLMDVNEQGKPSVYSYKDNASGTSLPGAEYVVNHWVSTSIIFTAETEKRNRQLLFDVAFGKNGQMYMHPVITNTKYNLRLNNGIQVSSNSIIFPFYNSDFSALSFAKMDLE